MKFIFPKNYNLKPKLFGIFDYATIFINFIYYFIIFILINLFLISLNLKIIIFIIFCFPFFLFSFIGFNGENFLDVFLYLINFCSKRKLLLFLKNN